MQNFKSDQRQLVVADDGSGGWIAALAPTGAAAGVLLRGSLARAMIASELRIAAWSTDDDRLPAGPPMEGGGVGSIDVRFLTEGAIAAALRDAMAAAGSGDEIDFAVDDLGERRVIAAVLDAAARGAQVRALLSRNPVPNLSAAGELLQGGAGRVQVRWRAADAGPHLKLLTVRHGGDFLLNLGSANFTRRSLDDLNLEAAVELRMPARAATARAVADYFAKIWAGAAVAADRTDASAADYWRYRFAEATGLSSF
jgi:phosphatidylserine/phosphatidylglycerophosphate/cardiolipin synthase-like enzyme